MRKITLLIACLLTVLISQAQKAGALTIFSEDGDKFYLVLNGEKQNTVAQTNLRIEELPQPYYNAKIMFEDSTILPVSKKALYIADADGTMKDVTYKMRKDKTGKVKLNYYSMTDIVPDFVPPSNVRVYHYGRPSETEVITTTTTTNAPVSANVNMSGVSMNVTINDPVFSESTTTTTTSQSHSTSSSQNRNSNRNSDRNDERGTKCSGSFPMRSPDFTAAKSTIADASFEDSKLSTAKSIATSNCLSAAQVTEICGLFSFEESKLAFAKFAYRNTTDPKNYFKVNNVFTFDSSKDELNKFTSGE